MICKIYWCGVARCSLPMEKWHAWTHSCKFDIKRKRASSSGDGGTCMSLFYWEELYIHIERILSVIGEHWSSNKKPSNTSQLRQWCRVRRHKLDVWKGKRCKPVPQCTAHCLAYFQMVHSCKPMLLYCSGTWTRSLLAQTWPRPLDCSVLWPLWICCPCWHGI
jgi:hypothetical protein